MFVLFVLNALTITSEESDQEGKSNDDDLSGLTKQGETTDLQMCEDFPAYGKRVND